MFDIFYDINYPSKNLVFAEPFKFFSPVHCFLLYFIYVIFFAAVVMVEEEVMVEVAVILVAMEAEVEAMEVESLTLVAKGFENHDGTLKSCQHSRRISTESILMFRIEQQRK